MIFKRDFTMIALTVISAAGSTVLQQIETQR